MASKPKSGKCWNQSNLRFPENSKDQNTHSLSSNWVGIVNLEGINVKRIQIWSQMNLELDYEYPNVEFAC